MVLPPRRVPPAPHLAKRKKRHTHALGNRSINSERFHLVFRIETDFAMSAETFDDPRILIAGVTILWTALGALVRRAVISVERKIDANQKSVSRLEKQVATMIGDTKYRIEKSLHAQEQRIVDAERRMADRTDDINRQSVSRHEFTLLIANVDTKLGAIYDKVALPAKRKPRKPSK